MEFTWRCNITSCRTELVHQAVVTTCSHIFCVECATNSGLANAQQGVRICPACEAHLTNQDDAVITQLDPPEDYKTSVLSGFTPSLIMECAGRALAFYNYQAVHESTYQDFLARRLTQKVSGLNEQMDGMIKQANSHIHKLQDALKDSQARCLEMENKNQEAQHAFGQKAKALKDLTKKYEVLKSEKMAAQTMNAASDEAEQMVQNMAGNRFAMRPGAGSGLRRPHSGSSASESVDGLRGMRSFHRLSQQNRAPSRQYTAPIRESNSLFISPNVQKTNPQMPGNAGRIPRTAMADGAGVHRQPLSNIATNSYARPSNSAYGMNNATKMGKRPLRAATPRINRHAGPSDIPMR